MRRTSWWLAGVAFVVSVAVGCNNKADTPGQNPGDGQPGRPGGAGVDRPSAGTDRAGPAPGTTGAAGTVPGPGNAPTK